MDLAIWLFGPLLLALGTWVYTWDGISVPPSLGLLWGAITVLHRSCVIDFMICYSSAVCACSYYGLRYLRSHKVNPLHYAHLIFLCTAIYIPIYIPLSILIYELLHSRGGIQRYLCILQLYILCTFYSLLHAWLYYSSINSNVVYALSLAYVLLECAHLCLGEQNAIHGGVILTPIGTTSSMNRPGITE